MRLNLFLVFSIYPFFLPPMLKLIQAQEIGLRFNSLSESRFEIGCGTINTKSSTNGESNSLKEGDTYGMSDKNTSPPILINMTCNW